MKLRNRDLLWLLPAAVTAWLDAVCRSLARRIKGERPPGGPPGGVR